MNNDFKARMARYEQELLRLRQRSHLPETTPSEPSTSTQEPLSVSTPPLSIASPLHEPPSHFQGNITQEQNSEEYPRSAEAIPPGVPAHPATSMRVSVISAQDKSPIADAIVTVDRRIPEGREPVHIRFTDQNGNTPLLLIPSGNAETLYDIQVAAEKHYHEILTGLTADTVGGNHRIMLKPLPEH